MAYGEDNGGGRPEAAVAEGNSSAGDTRLQWGIPWRPVGGQDVVGRSEFVVAPGPADHRRTPWRCGFAFPSGEFRYTAYGLAAIRCRCRGSSGGACAAIPPDDGWTTARRRARSRSAQPAV